MSRPQVHLHEITLIWPLICEMHDACASDSVAPPERLDALVAAMTRAGAAWRESPGDLGLTNDTYAATRYAEFV